MHFLEELRNMFCFPYPPCPIYTISSYCYCYENQTFQTAVAHFKECILAFKAPPSERRYFVLLESESSPESQLLGDVHSDLTTLKKKQIELPPQSSLHSLSDRRVTSVSKTCCLIWSPPHTHTHSDTFSCISHSFLYSNMETK